MLPALNFRKWIEENKHLLKPPVGNAQIWQDREFMVTVIGGPNTRTDYHVNEGEEFFYQLEGTMNLKMIENGKFIDFPIQEGEIFLLPPNVPHSPRRPAGTLGLVIERQRREHELDGFLWFCENCQEKLHEEFIHLNDIVKDLPPVFDRFFKDEKKTTCRKCNTAHVKP